MTRPILVLAFALSPALGTAQSAPPITSGQAIAASKPNSSAANATVLAQNTLNSIRRFCRLTTLDGKLVAACDDTTRAARTEHLMPDNLPAWGMFAKKLADADATVNGKARGIVVLKRGELIAEVTSTGVLRLKN